jgi:hypothetical protein
MRRMIHAAAAILAAVLTLMLFASAVRSGASADRAGQNPAQAAASVEHASLGIDYRAGSGSIQSAPEYSRTRIVTITVGTTTVPGSPGLNSRWQIDTLDQKFFTGTIALPPDASAVTVTLVNGVYSIDYARPAILITNSQGLYYEYRTDQQAQRFGNQILISQTYKYFPSLHYVETVIFTDPYRYVGYSGYAPAQINATRLHWDKSFTGTKLHEFEAAAWLVDPGARPRPDLEIVAARVVDRRLNHIYVTATIQNNGGMTAGAPAFVNLYDRLTPSPPAGPLDLAGGWCTLDPATRCGDSTSRPLPAVPPFGTVTFTAEYDVSAIYGRHYIYLYVDALGVAGALGRSDGVGLNYESEEGNNSRLAGSLFYWNIVFLPLVQLK